MSYPTGVGVKNYVLAILYFLSSVYYKFAKFCNFFPAVRYAHGFVVTPAVTISVSESRFLPLPCKLI